MVQTQYFKCFIPPDYMVLESGQKLSHVTLAYETYGKLSSAKDNAVLVCHGLTGDAHAAFSSSEEPENTGWWDEFIGPGKAIDTDKYFVICSNTIGGCKGSTGPGSIDPETGKPYGLTFPVITVGDMVQAQKALVDYLKLPYLKMVIGGSMGGMQALEWSIMYPEFVKSCTPIACTEKLSPQALAFDAVGRNAITLDSNWKGGKYDNNALPENGLAIARMIGHITYLSNESMKKKFGRKLQKKNDYGYDFSTDFQVESYLKYQGSKFVQRFDANSYLYVTKAISYFDLQKKYGSLDAAFEKTRSKFLVISISSDWLYPPQQSKKMVKTLMKLNKEVTYCDIDSLYGHDAFLLENKQLSQIIRPFLEQV